MAAFKQIIDPKNLIKRENVLFFIFIIDKSFFFSRRMNPVLSKLQQEQIFLQKMFA